MVRMVNLGALTISNHGEIKKTFPEGEFYLIRESICWISFDFFVEILMRREAFYQRCSGILKLKTMHLYSCVMNWDKFRHYILPQLCGSIHLNWRYFLRGAI